MGPERKTQRLRALGTLWLALLVTAAAGRGSAEPPGTATAKGKLERGDVQGALTELDALPPAVGARGELRYLRARLLERLGRVDEALLALPQAAAELEPLPEPIRGQVRELRARWLARLGRCTAAMPLLVELEAGNAPEHVLRAAECALAAGNPTGALVRFERTPTDGRWVDAVAVGLTRAEALIQVGRGADAQKLLRQLYVERPEHAASEAVRAALLAAGGSDALSLDEHLARAERFMEVRAPARALEELDAAKAPRERAARAKYLYARGMALYGMRTRYAEAARVLEQAAALPGANAVDAAFHAARALSRADQDASAIAAYRKIARAHAGTAQAAEAEYLAAWLELRAGRPRGARELTRIVEAPTTPPGRRRSARFELAMYRFDRREYAPAAALFSEYASGGGGAMLEGRGLYWAARAQQLAAHASEAEALYRKVLGIEPLHWYALLARQRLQELGVTVPAPFEGAPKAAAAAQGALPALALPELARFFANLGLRDDARVALQTSEADLQQRAPAGRGLEALIRAYHALGEHARPLTLATREYPDLNKLPPDATNRWLWDAAFPRPHQALVAELEQAEQLPAGYLHAIMRKESGFDPHVVSYADAIGLMQLLPATARGVGQRLGMEVEREALFDPELNLRLSARFNAELLRSLDGVPLLAIAAYNAGLHRVRPWVAREAKHGKLELDRFVERIPIEQTRNYVRRVVTNWARYLYLAEPEPRGWPLSLPLVLEPPGAER